MRHILIVFNFFLSLSCLAYKSEVFALSPHEALQMPVQAQTAPPRTPDLQLPASFTSVVSRDWAAANVSSSLAAKKQPDHSLKTIWVRMFPLATVPINDPYPVTVDLNKIDIENAAGLAIYNLETQALLGNTTALHLDFGKTAFKIGSRSFALQKLWIVPAGTLSTLRWDKGQVTDTGTKADVGVSVRGEFVVKQTMYDVDALGKPHFTPSASPRQLWSVINVIDINKYIESVVPSEVIASWSTETLKAQAIAARTYGMFEVAEARTNGIDWDVDPSTWYQSYRGVEFYDRMRRQWSKVEQPATTAACNATANEVITYRGSIIKAYFSANSGGVTCTVSECFSLPDQPYLLQVNDAADVRTQPGGTWGDKATLTPANIKAKMLEGGVSTTGTVSHIEALSHGPSGRTWTLRVHLTTGSPIDLDNLQSRKIMHLFGPVRSFLYTLGAMRGGTQAITGHGFGHGVGLSQWGAQSFANQGWDAHKILTHYYGGVSVTKL